MTEVSSQQMKLYNKSLYLSRETAFQEAFIGGMIYDDCDNNDEWRRFSSGEDHSTFLSWTKQMDSDDETVNTKAFPINCAFKAVSTGRYFVTTSRGHIGWGPRGSEIGDSVVVMPGGKVSYILRKMDNPDPSNKTTTQHYTFIGDAYIQGIMDGEFTRERGSNQSSSSERSHSRCAAATACFRYLFDNQ
ncbi:Heterokaryon incompatibility protein [Pyrenophora tritici-repentis]|uniref:Heterokaryon incompatibility protein n=1 Tax=Pyrenophora tritici-repentis TaxID=45151 RepID=A0A2W1HJ68_9PLEO|nr:Heterokaryon incompatibility protein [Pyrenophora tritici-repentis]KAF7574727.1 hypothetical protein PtrM4_063510 [Pyrenophora tritici-repentis]KAG9386501.1 Heterokaryon incompatibility protein [Pyrenophora tritici-repentis]KAI1518796.1 Heterokaryon incompatibility protein [Pyrenophora tritici-repentis]KAI1551276.1 hypothetical protein PtrSN001A_000009 [Pyrenophora tritici-repentis]